MRKADYDEEWGRFEMKQLMFVSVACLALAAAPRAFGTQGAAAPTLKAGDQAPDFSLMGSDGKVHKLADLKGKYVVLAWFPKAMTSGCTAECHSITENAAVLQTYNVEYFMVSVDTPELNKQFADRDQPNFPLLSDPDKKVATAYGVLGANGLANRWTFYIGPDGKLVKVDTDQRNHTLTAGADLAKSFDELHIPKKK
jgi:peroxiredoxin Q/BCP